MAIGGTFLSYNKVLPGAYINFISQARATNSLSDRGVVAMPFSNNWSPESQIITVTSQDFLTNSLSIFGYDYSDDKLLYIREVFKNASILKFYRLGGGSKGYIAIGDLLVTAKYSGTRGNDIKIKISQSIDTANFTIYTYLGTTLVDEVEVTSIYELVDDIQSNDYVEFSIVTNLQSVSIQENEYESQTDQNTEEDLYESISTLSSYTLSLTAGVNLQGATDYSTTNAQYSSFLSNLECESFNTLIYAGEDNIIKSLFDLFTKRLRDEEGSKFVTVLYDYTTANFEGVISVKNYSKLAYWVAGASAGAEVNESITNKIYDGELSFNAKFSNSELKEAIQDGQLVLFEDDGDFKVLKDINTFTEFSDDKNSDFSNNQVIRVIDSIANDVAKLFNTYYLGKVQNDNLGRDIFKSELINYFRTLQAIRAIDNFDPDDISIQKGSEKGDVVVELQIEPVASMDKLYMKCIII
ncbi:MAG: phage tail sheath family protein [bacterium]